MEEDLEYHYNETEVNLRFFEILRRYSDDKNDPVPEWELVPEMTVNSKERCICSTKIIDNYYIRHTRTGKVLVIGSECIKRWISPKLKCKECGAALGRVCRRIKTADYLCRSCKLEAKKEEERKEQERETKIARMEKLVLFWYGPYYQKPFYLVAKDIPYVEYLLNHPKATTSETLKAFQKYASLVFEIQKTQVSLVDPKANSSP